MATTDSKTTPAANPKATSASAVAATAFTLTDHEGSKPYRAGDPVEVAAEDIARLRAAGLLAPEDSGGAAPAPTGGDGPTITAEGGTTVTTKSGTDTSKR